MKIVQYILICSLVIISLLIAGCGGEPETAKDGDTVSVHYHGTLDDGTVFDTSRDGDPPLQFVLGAEQMIAGFENAVRGMEVGETKTVTIPPEEAYGLPQEELFWELERNIFEEKELYEGQRLHMQNTQTGQSFWVTVVSFDEETVIVDANHEMAGKTLTFEIELVAIEAAE